MLLFKGHHNSAESEEGGYTCGVLTAALKGAPQRNGKSRMGSRGA